MCGLVMLQFRKCGRSSLVKIWLININIFVWFCVVWCVRGKDKHNEPLLSALNMQSQMDHNATVSRSIFFVLTREF